MQQDTALEPGSSTGAELSTVQEPLFPFLDLRAQSSALKAEIRDAIGRVMESGRFILGAEVESLETDIAARLGVRAAVGCASGSDALLLALMALGIGRGDEVITSPFTFVATVSSPVRLGARPVFVDICADTFNLDTGQVEVASSSRTRAVIPVHLFGLPADMAPLLRIAAKHAWAVIEDAAQAIGAGYQSKQAGSLGTMGCFSFFPSKNLGGAGDGGMITTSNPELESRLRVLRDHGSRSQYHYEMLGINSRLDALQAAVLRVKLRHLDEWTKARRQKADFYQALFADVGLKERVRVPPVPERCFHVYNQFTIRCADRDRLRDYLCRRGIPTAIYYPLPLYLQPAFAYLGYKPGAFPQSEAASREVLSLPLYPELKRDHQVAVVRAIADFYGGRAP
jgi:dTDP-4-amino-4,6-dideoxygalactose transaminase